MDASEERRLTSRNTQLRAYVMVPVVTWNVAILAIAAIYYVWRDTLQKTQPMSNRHLNERVAHMLWVAAQRSQ
jgi:hypothetical protein